MAKGDRTVLTLEPREERGSRANRRLRRAGNVPGVIYGIESDTVSFKVDARRLRPVLAEGHALFDIEVDGGKREPVIVKDQQRDPVRGHVLHIDLLKVRLDEKIQTTVALELEGVEDAPGVKEGGVLEHVTRELNVEALPTAVPDRIVADVSGLGIAETMMLSRDQPAGRRRAARRPGGDRRRDRHRAEPGAEEPESEIEEEAELVGEGEEAPGRAKRLLREPGAEEGSSEGSEES